MNEFAIPDFWDAMEVGWISVFFFGGGLLEVWFTVDFGVVCVFADCWRCGLRWISG